MRKKVTFRTETTEDSQYNMALSRMTQKAKIFGPSIDRSRVSQHQKQNSTEKTTKLDISIYKKKILNHKLNPQQQKTQIPKVNPHKFRINLLTTKSTETQAKKMIYGITSFKGFKNYRNPHHIRVNLGMITNIVFCQAYDGSQAAIMAKQVYPLELNACSTTDIEQNPQKFITHAFKQTQHKMMTNFYQNKNNSSCSLLSLIIGRQLITVGNCGASKAICQTKTGQFIQLCNQHTTKNEQQLNRIIKSGGKIYQTTISVPNNDQLSIDGPLRVSPSGLVYTRTIGKVQQYSSKVSIVYTPQVKYINKDDVKWVILISQGIANNTTVQQVGNFIQKQIRQCSSINDQNQKAQVCSKKLIENIIKMGICDALSAAMIIIQGQQQNSSARSVEFENDNFNISFQQKTKVNYQQIGSKMKYYRKQKRGFKESAKTYKELAANRK